MAITLVIHGGAGNVAEEDHPAYLRGLLEARDAGFVVLEQGADALAAVLAAVRTMEDNPAAFNAGTGGSPNRDGVVECDAAVMTGWDRSAGAVTAVAHAKNPILLAAKVRRESPHVLLAGEGAEVLLEERVANRELLTPRMQRAYQRWLETQKTPKGSATVGAVALDGEGRLAAATSTGGMLGKWPGRVGDSPLPGAGTYADARLAVSCTGKGEAFMRAVSAKALACAVAAGMSLEEAVQEALEDLRRCDGDGGLISLTAKGELCVGYNSSHMAYAWKTLTFQEATVGQEPGILSR
jgi:isoaspartyl peptidase/L-asparaginase-like protein (Ntn-hydrolase superfamily)